MTAPGNFSSGDVLTAADMNGLPGGVLDVDSFTAPITGLGVGFPGTTVLTVSATLDSNRRYRVRVANAYWYNGTGAQTALVEMFLGAAGTSQRRAIGSVRLDAAGFEASIGVEYIVNGGVSGAQTFLATGRTDAGTASLYASAGIPTFMYIEDIGAV